MSLCSWTALAPWSATTKNAGRSPLRRTRRTNSPRARSIWRYASRTDGWVGWWRCVRPSGPGKTTNRNCHGQPRVRDRAVERAIAAEVVRRGAEDRPADGHQVRAAGQTTGDRRADRQALRDELEERRAAVDVAVD